MTTETERNETPVKLLALDTSTSALTVALSIGDRIAMEHSSHAERNHSIQLIPAIDAMLKQAGIAPRELDAIAVGHGPGSYTGVRIGVSVAKTFAWSLGIPVVSVSSLGALALGASDSMENKSAGGDDVGNGMSSSWYIPLLDARRGQAFCAIYAAKDGAWSASADDGIRVVADWGRQLFGSEGSGGSWAEAAPGRIHVVGETSGFEAALGEWRERLADRADLKILPFDIRASAVAKLALRRLVSGEQDDTHGLVPNYTQLAEAEVKLLKKERQGGEPCGGVS